VSSRITFWFDVANSPSFTAEDKEPIVIRLGSRAGKDGMLRGFPRRLAGSQLVDRESAIERFVGADAGGTEQAFQKIRRHESCGTVKERRLKANRRRSLVKRERSREGRGLKHAGPQEEKQRKTGCLDPVPLGAQRAFILERAIVSRSIL